MRLIVLALLLLPVAALAQDSEAEAEDVAVVNFWQGDRSRITEPEVARITDAAAWFKLWERHAGKNQKPPAVDFDKHMVLANFLGASTWEKLAVHAVKRTKTELVFGLEVEPADCCDCTERPHFLMAVLPKSDLKCSVILRVRSGMTVDPRKDKLLKEFPATEEK